MGVYIKGMEMPKSCHKCFIKQGSCPFQETIQGVTDSCCAYKENLWRTEDYVSVVESWSKTCPARNNETVFVETFGFDPVSIRFGTKKWYEAWLEAEYKEPSDGN